MVFTWITIQELEIGKFNGIGYTVIFWITVADLVTPNHVAQYWIQGKSEKDDYCERNMAKQVIEGMSIT